jgi:hypothetical protein
MIIFVLGYIRRQPAGGFAYFESSKDAERVSLRDNDLETLKNRIRASPPRTVWLTFRKRGRS